MNASLVMLAVALGAAGLYLAIPGSRLRVARLGMILLLGAAAALLAAILPTLGPGGEKVSFAVLATIGLLGAVRVVTHPRPVYAALFFILVAIATAGLLVMLEARFVAAALVIIYGGAILVTYLFVIMLAQRSEGPAIYDRQSFEPLAGILAGFVLLAVVVSRILNPPLATAAAPTLPPDEAIYRTGAHLLTQYAVAVQIAAVVLLAAMVGAIAIARRRALGEELLPGAKA